MILVTGATGFLGAELAKQLTASGYQIRCIKRSTSVIPALLLPQGLRIEWVEADLLDLFALENALENVTQVYHCAAWVSLKEADKEPMILANVTGTANLVNLCVQKNIRLLHVSSVAAVGFSKPGELINENHHLDQAAETDGYAISKLESEMEVWRGIAEGLNAVIVNPSIIIGASAGVTGSGALFEMVRKGLKFYTSGRGGFVAVEDAARCMILLMESGIQNERFIISAENRDYQQLTTEIAGCFGVKAPSSRVKPWVLGIAWRAAKLISAVTGKDPAIDRISAVAANQQRLYDNSKIKKALSFQFKPLSDSIKEICASLKAKTS
jgi:nucleoside-diphosphate-sugar epimerase